MRFQVGGWIGSKRWIEREQSRGRTEGDQKEAKSVEYPSPCPMLMPHVHAPCSIPNERLDRDMRNTAKL